MTSTSATTFKTTDKHMVTLNVFSAVYVPMVDDALANAVTFIGVSAGCGTYKITSSFIDTTPSAVPDTLLASTYVTTTGTFTVACTREKFGLSSNLVITRFEIVAGFVTELYALMYVNGYVGLAGFKFVMFSV